jgi:hypothetical protein
MKTISVSSRSKSIQDLLKKARKSGVIIESPAGKRYVLAPLGNWQAYEIGENDDFAQEVEATSRNAKLIKDMASQRAPGPRTSLKDVKKQLGLK